MKPRSMFINASRGMVVDDVALREHILSGHIAGAALDVFPVEPKAQGDPFESALRGLPNVILTPHVGGSTQEAQEEIGFFVSGKLSSFAHGGGTALSVNLPEVAAPPLESGSRHRAAAPQRARACSPRSTSCWPTTRPTSPRSTSPPGGAGLRRHRRVRPSCPSRPWPASRRRSRRSGCGPTAPEPAQRVVCRCAATSAWRSNGDIASAVARARRPPQYPEGCGGSSARALPVGPAARKPSVGTIPVRR